MPRPFNGQTTVFSTSVTGTVRDPHAKEWTWIFHTSHIVQKVTLY